MAPDHPAQKPDGQHRIDEHPRAEQRLAHAGDEHVRNDAHRRQNRYVNFGVAKKPEEVLP
jgi:hypothetical protein